MVWAKTHERPFAPAVAGREPLTETVTPSREQALSNIEGWDAERPETTPPAQDPYAIDGLFEPARTGAPSGARRTDGARHGGGAADAGGWDAPPGGNRPAGDPGHRRDPGRRGDQGDASEPDDDDAPRKTRKRHRRNVLIGIAVFIVLLVVGATGLFFERQSAYNSNIKRIPGALPTNDTNRPAAGPKGAENWLLIGSDTRVEGEQAGQTSYGGQRSDTIMLVHLPKDRKSAYLVSIPRDSWVSIPGHGKSKINAAFSWGGSPLLIRTIEGLTGVRVDHFAILNFEGMQTMTNALGGVDVRISQTVTDPMHHQTWQAGVNHLDGDRALWFVRQRYGLAGGDFDRIKRQQAFLKALANKSVSRGTLKNPLKLNAFLEALTKSVSVDDTVSVSNLRSIAFGSRGMRAGDIAFMTAPTKGTGRVGKQSVVFLDPLKDKALFKAIQQDTVADYLKDRQAVNNVDTVH
jgi:LCP family protein required for cell wall assembly